MIECGSVTVVYVEVGWVNDIRVFGKEGGPVTAMSVEGRVDQ